MTNYEKLYADLIAFRKSTQPVVRWNTLDNEAKEVNLPPFYGEYHHIKPRSLFPDLIDDPDNIVCLSAYEHILAHLYLALWYKEKYGENSEEFRKMIWAYDQSTHATRNRKRIKLTLEEAAMASILVSQQKSKNLAKWNMSEEGRKIHKVAVSSPTARENFSKAHKGKPLSQKNRDGITKTWRTEKKRSEQGKLLRKLYAERPEYHENVSAGNRRRYSDSKERERTAAIARMFYEEHPENAQKHSEDLKGRISVYSLSTGHWKRVKVEKAAEFLENGYYLNARGRKRAIELGHPELLEYSS